MVRRKPSVIRVSAMLAAVVWAAACGDGATGPAPPVTVLNRAPEAVGTISDLTLNAGDTESVDVSSYFSDPDGDALSYGAASSDAEVATVSVSGSTVTVTGVAEGTATVTMTASDPDGLSASQSFAANVLLRRNLSVAAAHLIQATQNLSGDVPLIAGRRALLRAFATVDEYTGPGIVSGAATFFLDGVEVYETTLSEPTAWGSGLDIPLAGDTIMCFTRRIPEGYPCGPEGRLALSFNARIPGHVLQPGLEMVVELDAEGILLLQPGSQPRFPASGSVALDVVEVPPLSLTIVPVLYDTDANRSTNAHVEAVARDLAGPGSEGALLYTREVLPIGELHVNLREPWYTTADTATGAA